MNIGYASISTYDSFKYDLFFDKQTNMAYFDAFGRKNSVILSDGCVANIMPDKKIWIIMSNKPISSFTPNTQFNENEMIIRIV